MATPQADGSAPSTAAPSTDAQSLPVAAVCAANVSDASASPTRTAAPASAAVPADAQTVTAASTAATTINTADRLEEETTKASKQLSPEPLASTAATTTTTNSSISTAVPVALADDASKVAAIEGSANSNAKAALQSSALPQTTAATTISTITTTETTDSSSISSRHTNGPASLLESTSADKKLSSPMDVSGDPSDTTADDTRMRQARATAAVATADAPAATVPTPATVEGNNPTQGGGGVAARESNGKSKPVKKKHDAPAARLTQPCDVLRMLCQAKDPFAAIEAFQHSHGLRLPSVEPAFAMLDLLGVKRGDVYRNVLARLIGNLKEVMPNIPLDVHSTLIHRSLPYIQIPELSEVCTQLLSTHPNPPRRILRLLSRMSDTDPNARAVLASHPQLRQRMWENSLGAFMNHVSPLVENYVRHCVFRVDTDERFPKNVKQSERRANNNSMLQPVREAIGSSYLLYHHVVLYVRRRFQETGGDWRFCCLRVDLIMMLQDLAGMAEDGSAWKSEPLWQFAVYMEAYCNLVNRTVAESRTTISEVAKKVDAVLEEFKKVISRAHYNCKEEAARMAVVAAAQAKAAESASASASGANTSTGGVKRPRTPNGTSTAAKATTGGAIKSASPSGAGMDTSSSSSSAAAAGIPSTDHHQPPRSVAAAIPVSSSVSAAESAALEAASQSEVLYKEMHGVLSKIEREDANRLFYRPVLVTDPDLTNTTGQRYADCISRPMDTQTVRRNLEEGKYTTLDAFKADLKQIYLNSAIFWGDKMPITKTAKKWMVTRASEWCHQADQRMVKAAKRNAREAKALFQHQQMYAAGVLPGGDATGLNRGRSQSSAIARKASYVAPKVKLGARGRHLMVTSDVRMMLASPPVVNALIHGLAFALRTEVFVREELPRDSTTCKQIGFLLEQGAMALDAVKATRKGDAFDTAYDISHEVERRVLPMLALFAQRDTKVDEEDHDLMLQACQRCPAVATRVLHVMLVTVLHKRQAAGAIPRLIDTVVNVGLPAHDLKALGLYYSLTEALEVQGAKANAATSRVWKDVRAQVIDKLLLAALLQHVHAASERHNNNATIAAAASSPEAAAAGTLKESNGADHAETQHPCTSGLGRMAVELSGMLARALLVQANTDGADQATLANIVGQALGLLVHGVQGVLPGTQESARMLNERYLSAEFGLARVHYEALFAAAPTLREQVHAPDKETVNSQQVLPPVTEPPPEASPPLVPLVSESTIESAIAAADASVAPDDDDDGVEDEEDGDEEHNNEGSGGEAATAAVEGQAVVGVAPSTVGETQQQVAADAVGMEIDSSPRASSSGAVVSSANANNAVLLLSEKAEKDEGDESAGSEDDDDDDDDDLGDLFTPEVKKPKVE